MVMSTGKGFRETILQKLGNAQLEDSNVVSADENASADFVENARNIRGKKYADDYASDDL